MALVLFTVIDLETTGMEPPADVIELGWSRLYFDTETKQSEIKGPYSRLFRNRQEMSPENIAVHHLTPAMLAPYEYCDEDALRAVLDEERPDFLVAANCDFEKRWLTDEVVGTNLDGKPPHWICSVKCASRLYPDAESHSNQATRYRLALDLPEELAMPPHRAGPDSYVTAHVLGRFLLQAKVRELVQWTLLPRWMPTIRFGKHRGTAWADLPIDYLQWLAKQSDMDSDVLYWVGVELERRSQAA